MSVATAVRLATRPLPKDRWFTFAAAKALALGIAATMTMFSIADGSSCGRCRSKAPTARCC